MSYYIKQQLISMNRPKEKFVNLKGITIHSTANIGATSLNHFNYWNNADRQSSVHFIADWIDDYILQLIPENEIAWHTGSWQGNREWLGIEMCETADKNQFEIVWNKTVWFVADLCIKHNWNVDDNVWSHNGLRSLYKGIDHTDPYNYLTRMGKTWKQLCDAIDTKIVELKNNKEGVVNKVADVKTNTTIKTDKDIYLSVRVLESKADELTKKIIAMGFATKRLDLA